MGAASLLLLDRCDRFASAVKTVVFASGLVLVVRVEAASCGVQSTEERRAALAANVGWAAAARSVRVAG